MKKEEIKTWKEAEGWAVGLSAKKKGKTKEMVYCMDFDLGSIVRVQPNMECYIGGETSETNYTECRAGGLYLTDSPSGISGSRQKGENVYSRVANTSKSAGFTNFSVCCSGRIKSTAKKYWEKSEPKSMKNY